jgi:hypothetical protein
MKRSFFRWLVPAVAGLIAVASPLGRASGQAAPVARMLILRLTEVGGVPALTTAEVGCTGASTNGKQISEPRNFPVPERVIEYPFQSVSPSVCTLVITNVTDDDQLSVTINGVPVTRSGSSLVSASTKEVKATFSPITVDGPTEVAVRTKPVLSRAFKAEITASISVDDATQFSFVGKVFDCVGVVWSDTFSNPAGLLKTFPGVTSAQCKVRFTPSPGQKVVADFRTHIFFVNGKVTTPEIEADGSAVVNFSLSQFSGIRIISPSTPASPLVSTPTTKLKASKDVSANPATGTKDDPLDLNNGLCASLNSKTRKVTLAACKPGQKTTGASGSGLVAGPVSLPENQPVAEFLDRFRSAFANMYANPSRGKFFLAPLISSRSKFSVPSLVTRLAKETDSLYSAAGPEQFEFLDVTVKPLTRTTAEIRACERFSFELRNPFSNDLVPTKGGGVSETRFVIEKSASGIWKLLKDLPSTARNSECANATPLPSADPARIRTLEQTFPLPRGGEALLEAAKKYMEADQESSKSKGGGLEFYRSVVTPNFFVTMSEGKGPDEYWTGAAADSVLVRERASMISTNRATVEFCRVYGADLRNTVTEVVDPTSVGVKVTSIKLALSKVKGKWLVDDETYTEPDFGYSNCWVGAALPPNLANPRVK